jgi:serine/threonine protein kinase
VTAERWARIRQIFEGALERPPSDRAAYLRVVCARDDELRREVESLLDHHNESFLAEPAINLGQTLLYADESEGEYPEGYRVGPYQLDRRIGRGGMGSVWVAARVDHEYEKKVAVKLVRRGMDSHEILRRFRLERQVLAGLDHPNIARLIDGGSTPDGLPYLVMEYVEGTPITEYCESRKSTITERLRLFRAVCAAVQYAHSNLVVHRDIKAGNILVTPDGVPKLLDFGIAKVLRSDLSTLEMAQTRPEMRPMTLDYASPEQVRGEPIATATDVYSLGVLLYKLLTGKMPYGVETRSRTALQHAICEVEPRRPSSVIMTDSEAAIPQATQKLEVVEVVEETRDKARKRLKKKLAGDLDVIILKALRKEPPRRYASVEQFSEDIRRYMEGRPVIARSDTLGYRAAKFVRRNAAAVAAAATISLALIVSAIGSSYYARVAARQRDLAEQRFVMTRHELLAAYFRNGEIEANAANSRRAYEIAQAIYRQDPRQAEARRDFARAEANLGDLVAASGDRPEALSLYSDALAHTEALGSQRDVMTLAGKIGVIQFQMGNLLASLASQSRALKIAEGLYAIEPSEETRRAVAFCNFHAGEVLAHNGAPREGLVKLDKALGIYQELFTAHREDAEVRTSMIAIHHAMGDALLLAGRSSEAMNAYQQAMALLPAGSQQELQKQLQENVARLRASPANRTGP